MKKFLVLAMALVALPILFNSCQKDQNTSFDETLLYGKWQSGTVFYKYVIGYTGTTWDTADDQVDGEGLSFTWSLDNSDLTQIYVLELGGSVPKVYTVTVLNATTLTYHDSFGKSYTFTKVSK
jgi:hypothetical protein